MRSRSTAPGVARLAPPAIFRWVRWSLSLSLQSSPARRTLLPPSVTNGGGGGARRWGSDADGRCPLVFGLETRKTRFVGIP